MKVKTAINTAGLERKLRQADRDAVPATLEGVKVLGREFGAVLLRLSPRDTHRYVRGWAMAINEAGLGPVPVPDVVNSKYADWLLGRLELRVHKFEQRLADKKRVAEFWQRVYQNRYGREHRTGRWERDCAKKRDAAVKEAEKAAEMLARAEEVVRNFDPKGIVIWGRDSYDGKLRFREVHTQRLKIYGGTGYASARRGGAYLVLHNLEPHASIVEKSGENGRVVARAFESIKRPGVRKSVGDAVTRELVKRQRRLATAGV